MRTINLLTAEVQERADGTFVAICRLPLEHREFPHVREAIYATEVYDEEKIKEEMLKVILK